MNFERFLFVYIFITIQYTAFSQVDAQVETNFWNKVRYGGGMSLGFSNISTNVGLAPSAIYQFNDKVAAGISVSFGYSSFKRNDAQQFNYGASSLVLYNPTQALQLSAELEQNFVNSSFEIVGQKFTNNFNFPALYVGAGYRVSNISTGLRYDILYKENRNIYSSAISPFIRVYF